MSVREWLAGMFSEIAYRLEDGQQPPNIMPMADDPPKSVFGGRGASTGVTQPGDHRFAAWGAQAEVRAARFVPYLAVVGALVLVGGLIKFWQIATHRPGDPQQAIQDQEQGVARKFEDAYRMNSVKHELNSGPNSGPGSVANTMPPPAVGAKTPLIYFFPRGEAAYHISPRQQARSRNTTTYAPGATARTRVVTVQDPLVDVLRQYEPELETQEDPGGATPPPNNSIGGGPTWNMSSGR